MVVHGKLYRNNEYRKGCGWGWKHNHSSGGVCARGNQVNEYCDFGLVGSETLILVADIPRLSRAQSRIWNTYLARV